MTDLLNSTLEVYDLVPMKLKFTWKGPMQPIISFRHPGTQEAGGVGNDSKLNGLDDDLNLETVYEYSVTDSI